MLWKKIAGLLFVFSIVSSFSFAEEAPAALNIGSKAPALDVEWLQGEPVKAFGDGKIYVVEFWATWCGPCRKSIPHMNELQKKFSDSVTFIGVDASEGPDTVDEKRDRVNAFIKAGNPKIDYRVAFDGSEKTDAAWCEAAGASGIPFAFVIDGTGRIVYEGHPMLMAEQHVLEKVIDGSWEKDGSMEKLKKEREQALVDARVRGALARRINDAMNAGNRELALQVCDEALAKLGDAKGGEFAEAKAEILLKNKQFKEFDAWALSLAQEKHSAVLYTALLQSAYFNSGGGLNEELSFEGAKAMVQSAESKIDEPTAASYRPFNLYVLGTFYIYAKDYAKAETYLKEALKLADGNDAFKNAIQTQISVLKLLSKTSN